MTTLRSWLRRPPEELRGWQASLRFTADLTRFCAANLVRHRAAQMASSLAFHTLFSLIPMLVVMLVVVQAFKGIESYQERLETTVIEALLPEPLLAPERAGAPAHGGEGLDEDAAAAKARREFDEARRQLSRRVEEFLAQLRGISFGGIGVVGLLVFIYGATALLTTIEKSFNTVMGVRGGRPWYRRLPLYYTVITLGPLVLMAGQLLETRFLGILQEGDLARWVDWLAGPLLVLSPILTSWLVFFVMFALLPQARVSKRAAAIGSLVAAVLLYVTRALLNLYVANAGISTVYGALAVIPIFLLWLWLVWILILFGMELTEALQNLRSRRLEEALGSREDCPLAEPSWVLAIAAGVARAFAAGHSVAASALARELRLPQPHVAGLLEAMEAEGFARSLPGPDELAYMLARPAERVRLDDLLGQLRERLHRRPAGPDELVEGLVEAIVLAEAGALQGRTLAELVPTSAPR